jgi:hypothetical protein
MPGKVPYIAQSGLRQYSVHRQFESVAASAWSPGSAEAKVPPSLSLEKRGDTNMLMTLAVILIALWLLGTVSSYTMGGLIHLLLVVAIVVFLVRVIQGRRVV